MRGREREKGRNLIAVSNTIQCNAVQRRTEKARQTLAALLIPGHTHTHTYTHTHGNTTKNSRPIPHICGFDTVSRPRQTAVSRQHQSLVQQRYSVGCVRSNCSGAPLRWKTTFRQTRTTTSWQFTPASARGPAPGPRPASSCPATTQTPEFDDCSTESARFQPQIN